MRGWIMPLIMVTDNNTGETVEVVLHYTEESNEVISEIQSERKVQRVGKKAAKAKPTESGDGVLSESRDS
jgi:hypothetical protein